MSIIINEDIVKEIIKLASKYKEELGFGSKFTETGIQKTLYELKRQLPPENKIKENLPYYWFKAGAYSEVVSKTIDDLVHDQILIKEDKGHYVLYELKNEFKNRRFIQHDDEFIQVRKKLQEIVSNLQPFSIDKEIKSQYEDDAPSLFYPRFKLEFIPNIEAYEKIITSQEGLYQNFIQRECISKLLSVSASSLPFKSLFADFKNTFFDFEIAVNRILNWKRKERDPEFKELILSTVKLCTDIWNSFAYGARIMKHDSYYDDRVEEWEKMFNEKLTILKEKISDFYSKVLETTKPIDFDEEILSLQEFSENMIKIRKKKEIIFMNFQKKPELLQVPTVIVEKIKNVPEYAIFLQQGQLDWNVITKLDDEEFKKIIQMCANIQPIYVATNDNGNKTKTIRIQPNSLYAVEQIEIQH